MKERPKPLAPPDGSSMPLMASAGLVVGCPVRHRPASGIFGRPFPPSGFYPWPPRWSPCRARSGFRRRSALRWPTDCCQPRVPRHPERASMVAYCTSRCRCSLRPRRALHSVRLHRSESRAGPRQCRRQIPGPWNRDAHRLLASHLAECVTRIEHDRALAFGHDRCGFACDTEPFRSRSMYMSANITPWERMPIRSASTSLSATTAAGCSGAPAAQSSRATKVRKSLAGIRRTSADITRTRFSERRGSPTA